MTKVVQYKRFGSPQVLEMVELANPTPGPGEVRIAVKAVGLNPVDQKTFSGDRRLRLVENVQRVVHPSRWFAGEPSFPRGVARDFSGIVDAVGPGVSSLAIGDSVLGTLRGAPGQGEKKGALADVLVAQVSDVVTKPENLDYETAGVLGVAAQTVSGAFRHLNLTGDDVVVIAGASGGVGSLATQLAVYRGACVVGIASERNGDYLRSLGAIPVPYGDDVEERVREAAPGAVTKLLDCHLGEYAKLGFALGLSGRCIGSLAPNPPAMIRGAQFTGSRHAQPGDLEEIAQLVADGSLSVSIDRSYPFEIESIRAAYTKLAKGHVRGKLVIRVS